MYRKQKSFIAFIFIIGLALIILAIHGYFSGKIPSSYVNTNGTIIAIKTQEVRQPGPGNSYQPTYTPIIEYKVNGVTYKVDGPGGNNVVGQEKTVSYNPSDPANSPKIDSDKGYIGFGIVGTILGLVLVLISYRLYSTRNN